MKKKASASEKKKGKPHTVAFTIALVIVALLCAAVLELSKNTLFGWGALIVLLAAFVFVRRFLLQSGGWRGAVPLLC